MSFAILKNTLVGDDLREGLFDAQVLCYKILQKKTDRDLSLIIGDSPNEFRLNNRYYNELKRIFNLWNSQAVEDQMKEDDDLCKAVKTTVRLKALKRIRRVTKQTTRVRREVNKRWKQGLYGKNREIRRAINLIHSAYRETFVNVRKRLIKDAYDCIPDTLTITIQGKKEFIKYLYEYDAACNLYVLKSNIITSTEKLRELQMIIAPYIFNTIFLR